MHNEIQAKQVLIALQKVFANIEDEAQMGNNSVVRRIKSILAEALEPFEQELDVVPKPFKEPPLFPCRNGEMLSLPRVLDEFHADDRRRSVFIDPTEAILANMVDFVSGRLNTIEFRDPENVMDLRVIREKTRSLMRGKYPIVVVNSELSEDPAEIPFLLRSLADQIENDDYNVRGRECSNRTESLGTRWVNNGRTLEEGHRVVEKCCKRDKCCENLVCGERTISGGWTPIWHDGSTSAPPPLVPAPYGPSPWNDRLAFFDQGTQSTLVSDWGWRNLNGAANFHGGIDLAVPAGTGINSIDSGKVLFVRRSGHDSGIVIGNEGSIMFTYWHVTPNDGVKVGDTVSIGDYIGTVASGGPEHLHYAHHEPPEGKVSERSDSNSRNPVP